MGTPRLSATTSLSAIGALSAISVATPLITAPAPAPTLPGLLRAPGAPPHVIGHRGHPAAAPENTLASFRAARATGADVVELDTATSADGVPYVLHDATLDRTTRGTGRLRDHPSADLDALGVPRLTAALRTIARGDQRLLLELKGDQPAAAIARDLAAVRAAGLGERTVVMSYRAGNVRRARRIAPRVPRALLRDRLDADPEAVADRLGLAGYFPRWTALARRSRVVAALRARGVAVFTFTVDDPRGWRAAARAGVDGIITNRAGALAGPASVRGRRDARVAP